MKKISYLALITMSFLSASSAIAQDLPANTVPNSGANPPVPPNHSIQSRTAGGVQQTTIVDQNGNLKVVAPTTTQEPAISAVPAGAPQMPSAPPGTPAMQNQNITPAGTNMINPNGANTPPVNPTANTMPANQGTPNAMPMNSNTTNPNAANPNETTQH